MTGFRIAYGGAQEYFGVTPDVTTMGKVIGGGLPVGAYGGRKDIMEVVAPAGPMYQAGTLSGNPLAMAAGIKTMEILQREGMQAVHNRTWPGSENHCHTAVSRERCGGLWAGKHLRQGTGGGEPKDCIHLPILLNEDDS